MIVGGLFLDAGGAVAFEEQEFGAEEAAAFGAVADRGLGIVGRAEIGERFDADAVLRAAFACGVGERGAAAFGLGVERGFCGCLRVGVGGDVEQACAGVEDQRRARGDLGKRWADCDESGQAHRRGEDRDMRGGAAALYAEADDRGGVEAEQMRGEQVVRQQDRAGRVAQALVEVFARERAQDLAFEVEHVVGAFGEPGVAGGVEGVCLRTDRGAPRIGGALALGDRCVRGVGEGRVVEQGGMRGQDCAFGAGRGCRFGGEAVCDRSERGVECGAFGGCAQAFAGHGDLGEAEEAGLADRDAGGCGDAGQAAVGG